MPVEEGSGSTLLSMLCSLLRVELAARDKRAHEIAPRDGQKQMRRPARIVMDGHVRGRGAAQRALPYAMQEVRWRLVVGAAHFQHQPLPGFQEQAIGTHLDVELVDLARL